MLGGPRARALWGEPEVLARAGDLVDDRAVIRDHTVAGVTYLHLMFARHQIVLANRVEVESFHPGDAALDHLDAGARAALDRAAGAEYGPPARRRLGTADLALMRHEGAPARLS
jgi:hypothetical protein